MTLDPSGQFSTSSQFTGKAFAADYAVPTPARLTQAVYDMEAAYIKAAGRENDKPSRKNVNGGNIGGLTFYPGVYTFASGVTIPADITFEGGLDDVFIIQIAGTLSQTANTKVHLSGCAQAKNIFWQMSGFAYIGAGALMQGTILTKEKADFITGSFLIGTVLAQTAVNLQKATITQAADTCSSA
jgi:hypothetical protein